MNSNIFKAFHEDDELLQKTKTYINTFIRQNKPLNPNIMTKGLMNFIYDWYEKEAKKRKTKQGQDKIKAKQKEILKFFSRHSKKEIDDIFILMNLLVEAKQIIINKLNTAGHINTFLKISNGFRTTGQEGFVAIDHLTSGAVKIVDRMEFSKANFSSDIIKGWQR
jgi:hypothetical protein